MISLVILIALVLALGIMFYEVMIGFLLSLFLATLLTVLFWPLHGWIERLCHGHDRLAAGITTTVVLLIVLAPIGVVMYKAAVEADVFLAGKKGPQLDRETLDRVVANINDRFPIDLSSEQVIATAREKAKEWFGPVAGRASGFVGNLMIQSLVTVLALYYFLADGPLMITALARLIPLDHKYQEQLGVRFVDVTRAVASASIVAALTQGILLGIGYYFAGLKGLYLLVILTMFASFVPLIGSAAIWMGCSLWLYVDGHATAAIVLFIWSLVCVLFADNVLKPMVLHGQSKLHPLLALLSVLGGVQVLGPLGVFFGPMAVAFLQSGLNMLNAELELLSPHKGKREPKSAMM